jgi:hypothetical protein
MTTVPMADTVGPDARYIPTQFSKVAAYRTGGPDVLWNPGDAQRFTHTSIVWVDQSATLSVYGHGVAGVADIEKGAGTIVDFIAAAKARQAASKPNCLYCSIDNVPANAEAIAGAGLNVEDIDFWVANWNLNQAQASEFVGSYTITVNGKQYKINVPAVQWASPSSNPDTPVPFSDPVMTLKDANIDLSETAPNWYPYVAPKPPVVVTTKTGLVVTSDLETFKVVSTDSGKSWTQS